MTIGSGNSFDGRDPSRHGSRCPAIDSACVARSFAECRGECAWGGPHGVRTSARDPDACSDASRSSRPCSGLRSRCDHAAGVQSPTSVCRTAPPRREFCARFVVPAPSSRCEASCRLLHLSPNRFHGSARVRSTISGRVPAHHRTALTRDEVRATEDMVTSPAYRQVPTRTLAVLAQRPGTVCASPSTWHRLVRMHGWRRPRLRVHPTKPKVGVRTTRPERDVAHRHHRDPSPRRHTSLRARRDRQCLAAYSGVARGRCVRTGQPRDRTSRRQSGRDVLSGSQSGWRTRVWRTSTQRSTHFSPRACCGVCWP